VTVKVLNVMTLYGCFSAVGEIRITIAVANAKAIDRLRLNAQRLLIPTATWRTPYFSYFSMITRFLSFAVVIGNIF